MRKILSSILFTAWSISLFAQSEVSQNFTISNGLPSNRVYHSIIDSKGFVWFSTDKGVSRYDGYTFKTFTTRDGLTDNEVFFMHEDAKNRIWFMTYSGKLSYYKEGFFYNPQNTPMLKEAITEGMFSRAYEDKWGNILFITSANGFFLLHNEKFEQYFENHGFFAPYLSNNEIYLTVNSLDTSKLVQIKENGSVEILEKKPALKLSFYNWFENDSVFNISTSKKKENKWEIYSRQTNSYAFNISEIEIENNVSPIYIKKIANNIYIGTNKGLYTLNKKKKKLSLLGFANEQVSSICFDFEGNMWVTTLHQGVFLQPKINLKKYQNISENINEVEINPFTDEIWAGNPRKLYKISKKPLEAHTLPATQNYNEKITSFYFINPSEVLIGSDMGLIHYKTKFRLLDEGFSGVKNLAYNPYSKQIVGAFASGLIYINLNQKNTKLPKRFYTGRSTAALALSKNKFLMGSNNGLYEVNTTTGEGKLLLSSRINQIKKDKQGNIWCSSDVAGLYLYKGGKFFQFTEKDGLHTNNINKLTIDDKQRVWLSSPFGIIKTKYINNTLKVENFILSNILGKEQVNDVAIKQDTVLIATTAGLYYFKENSFKQQDIKPPLVINTVIIKGKPQQINHSYTLNYEQNNIQIDFTALSYSTQNLNYRYILSSMGEEWQYTTSRSVNLVDLNPGKYVLTIQAIKNGTIFSEPKQIKFIIIPPFYKAWWFYGIALIAIASLLTVIVRNRITAIRKRAYISQVIAESKQKALRAQMNPHFLFNSLISIQSFFLNKRNTEGQEYTSKFSKLIRNILDNSDKEFITIDDEAATLKNYTDLENIRLKNPFVFTISISEDIDPNNTYIPTMLLQPIIENAIWHGINYLKNQHGKIEVSFSKEGQNLKITVKDNGVGFAQSAEINKKRNHISKGNKLVKERLEAINIKRKNNVSYTATDNIKGGAVVTLIIPIEE